MGKPWDLESPLNLVGHSFGGETIRLLASLLAYGDEIEAKEKRRRANAAAEQKRAQIAADFADHVSDLINWMYRDLAHLEGEREDQDIHTMQLALFCQIASASRRAWAAPPIP